MSPSRDLYYGVSHRQSLAFSAGLVDIIYLEQTAPLTEKTAPHTFPAIGIFGTLQIHLAGDTVFNQSLTFPLVTIRRTSLPL